MHYSFVDEPENEGALVLPHPADDRGRRTNRGFVDLRGQQELAANLAESQPSRAMQSILIALARPEAQFFTIGCEVSAHQTNQKRFGAGRNLQIAASDFSIACRDRKYLVALSDTIKARVDQRCGVEEWAIQFLLSVIETTAIGGPGQLWSPVLRFEAEAATLQHASHSAEKLVMALFKTLADDEFAPEVGHSTKMLPIP